ncbi:Hypothetical predicted protein [Mytilus galloprovincialis]|uniref:Uncharacterized protein n=1 Tax=Mytilus galloprovincialis TaxID=29158 RepID=A0A8B6E180_MYTGA|nr:Hypothetical predicted protein [Mytilus galloprovincialis]
MDGLTWLEKMELLRSIKGKKEKSKIQKQPKFTFVKDIPPEDKHQRLIGNKGSPSPDNMTSLAAQGQTNSQLFEQRRIKHLLQQARLKRNVNFDWLTESPRFRHSQNSSKDDSDDSSVSDIEEEHLRTKSPKCFSPGMDVGHAESTLLSRYNIKPFVKGGGGWKVTPMTMQRARTIVYDD